MDDADGKNKEGKNTDGMLQDDDEMDIDAQMMQAAQPVHTRFAKHATHRQLESPLRESSDSSS